MIPTFARVPHGSRRANNICLSSLHSREDSDSRCAATCQARSTVSVIRECFSSQTKSLPTNLHVNAHVIRSLMSDDGVGGGVAAAKNKIVAPPNLSLKTMARLNRTTSKRLWLHLHGDGRSRCPMG